MKKTTKKVSNFGLWISWFWTYCWSEKDSFPRISFFGDFPWETVDRRTPRLICRFSPDREPVTYNRPPAAIQTRGCCRCFCWPCWGCLGAVAAPIRLNAASSPLHQLTFRLAWRTRTEWHSIGGPRITRGSAGYASWRVCVGKFRSNCFRLVVQFLIRFGFRSKCTDTSQSRNSKTGWYRSSSGLQTNTVTFDSLHMFNMLLNVEHVFEMQNLFNCRLISTFDAYRRLAGDRFLSASTQLQHRCSARFSAPLLFLFGFRSHCLLCLFDCFARFDVLWRSIYFCVLRRRFFFLPKVGPLVFFLSNEGRGPFGLSR